MAYYLFYRFGFLDLIQEPRQLIAIIQAQGYVGIIMIIGLMSAAVVLNPIPSAPIAVVSGAVYGHTWGTLYIVIGALIGAVIAFVLARFSGRDMISRLLGDYQFPQWIGTQQSMMLAILFARLVPFISFDWVSYGAGLTPIHFWRFALATAIGLLPASFLLAHFGSEMVDENIEGLIFYVLLLGLFVLIPILYGMFFKRRSEEVSVN